MPYDRRKAANDNRRERSVSASFNKATLRGRLGADPQIRVSKHGGVIVQFSLTTGPRACDRTGVGTQDQTECHHVVISDDRLSAIAGARLSKGCHVYVEGQLQTRQSADQFGNPQIKTEVVLCGTQARLILLNELGTMLDHVGA
jgi:single-strand DNA-binding protein